MQGGQQNQAAPTNPYIVSHGKNSQKNPKDPHFTSMFANQQVPQGDNMMPTLGGRVAETSGKQRPGTTANVRPAPMSNGVSRPTTGANNQGVNGWVGNNGNAPNRGGVPAVSSYPNQGGPGGVNPMFGNRSRKAQEDKPQIDINDDDFYYNNDPTQETLVEQNMYQILHDHRDCMKAKCLEVKPPVIKKSIYTKDYVPFDRDEPIRGDANSAKPPYKPFMPIDTDTTYGVVFHKEDRLYAEAKDS